MQLAVLEKLADRALKAEVQERDEIGRFGQGAAPAPAAAPNVSGNETNIRGVGASTRSMSLEGAYQHARRVKEERRNSGKGNYKAPDDADAKPTLFGDKPAAPRQLPGKPTERDLFGVPSFARPDAYEREGMYKYSPEQPRDDDGKWTEGSGGGGSAASSPAKAPRSPRAPRAASMFEPPPESGWERAGRYGLNALNVAALASLPFMIPGVGTAAAGLGARAAAAVGLGGRARAAAGVKMPAALAAQEHARLKTLYTTFGGLAAKEKTIIADMAANTAAIERAQTALAGRKFMDPFAIHNAERALGAAQARTSVLQQQMASVTRERTSLSMDITHLEGLLRGTKAPPAPSVFSRVTGKG